ncbi:hypothetical protein [Zhongshania sp.]|uniref:hypothetical protein n=1 Tax=Zhongshania sp. TaxID=1971902 RepID=UPI003561552F
MYKLDDTQDNTNKQHLTEVSQLSPLRWFAVSPTARNEFKRRSPSFKCRDYLNDVVTANNTGQTISEYGYIAEPGTCIARNGDFVVGITFSVDQEHYVELLRKRIKDFFNPMESRFGLKQTKIHNTDVAGHYILRTDKFWRSAGYVVSTYTAYIRMLTYIPEDIPKVTSLQHLHKIVLAKASGTTECSLVGEYLVDQGLFQEGTLLALMLTAKSFTPPKLPWNTKTFEVVNGKLRSKHEVPGTGFYNGTQVPLFSVDLSQVHNWGIKSVFAGTFTVQAWVEDLKLRAYVLQRTSHSKFMEFYSHDNHDNAFAMAA